MDLSKLKTFKCVADTGQVNLAANQLKIAKSAISAAISSLETSLGKKLFTRHYKGMKLTDEGKQLYLLSKKIFWDVDNFLEDLKEKNGLVEGELTIATSQGIASSNWFNNIIAIILENHKKLNLKIINYKVNSADSIVADMYLCPYIYDRLDLVQKKIEDVCFRLFASRHYVDKFGLPLKPSDLDNHNLISFTQELNNPFNNADSLLHLGREPGNPRKIVLHVNNTISLLKLVKMGVGIGALHVNDVLEHDLVALLEEDDKVITSTYLTHHKNAKNKTNIEAFSKYFLKN